MRLTGQRNKFGAVTTHVDGIRFDSRKEARRYQELKLLERAGEITQLDVHPEFPLWATECDEKPFAKYIADFRYIDRRSGHLVVEDVKSRATRTAVYRLKKQLAQRQHGIVITEV